MCVRLPHYLTPLYHGGNACLGMFAFSVEESVKIIVCLCGTTVRNSSARRSM